jgi:selenocysteine lyase/cysteine desulfurase
VNRREFFVAAASLVAFKNETLSLLERIAPQTGEPDDEDFWMRVREGFALDPNIVNLNNGGVCPSPRSVQDALRRQLEYGNQAPSYYMWRHLEPEIESVRKRLAKSFGCDAEEMAITRNASEALEICLLGIDLQPGDEVLTTDQDYPRMLTTLRQRERRDGIKLVQLALPPAPKTHSEVIRAFEEAITPKTKIILVCHVIFMTGAIFPVREICELGKKRGIPVIVDGAHAFAHFPFTNGELKTDYYGVSLHKWLLAPVGTGFLYVAKDRIEKLWPLMAAEDKQSKDIRKFEEIGTHPAANHNAIGEALTFHEMLGGERKAARFRYLRKRWVDKLADLRGIEYNTNLSPEHSCCLTNVEIRGIDPGRLAGWLLDKHGIFVTTIKHERFQGLRISPNVYTSVGELDRFADAMRAAANNGIG